VDIFVCDLDFMKINVNLGMKVLILFYKIILVYYYELYGELERVQIDSF